MTTIHLKEETWKKINQLKRPGETMDDVIKRLLKQYDISQLTQVTKGINVDELINEFLIATQDIEQTIDAMKKRWMEEN